MKRLKKNKNKQGNKKTIKTKKKKKNTLKHPSIAIR
jgi:hypothetical protein